MNNNDYRNIDMSYISNILVRLGEIVALAHHNFDGSIAETHGREEAMKQLHQEVALYVVQALLNEFTLEEMLTDRNIGPIIKQHSLVEFLQQQKESRHESR